MKFPILVQFATAALACLVLQGCVSHMRSVSSGVTTEENLEMGRFIPMATFTTQQVVCFYVSVTWDDVTQEGGYHSVDWNWYRDGKLVAHRDNYNAYFRSAPSTRVVKQPAAALGPGHYRVEFVLSGTKLAEAEFDII